MKNFSTYQRNIIINNFFFKYLKIKRNNNDCVWILGAVVSFYCYWFSCDGVAANLTVFGEEGG